MDTPPGTDRTPEWRDGYSQPGRITILGSLTPADTVAVVVHEFARELLHQRGDDRPASKTVRETEAEAVAFIVSTAIDIRSSVDGTDLILSDFNLPRSAPAL